MIDILSYLLHIPEFGILALLWMQILGLLSFPSVTVFWMNCTRANVQTCQRANIQTY